MSAGGDGDLARMWLRRSQESVCDSIEPWAHGTVVRASRHPTYYDFNLVRVEGEAALEASLLAAFADRALAGLAHRRIDIESIDLADGLRPELTAAGWRSSRVLWLRHHGVRSLATGVEVRDVPYDEVQELRALWHREDFPDSEFVEYQLAAREISLERDVRVLAVTSEQAPIAFAQLESAGEGAEVTQVYVHPDHRGRGLGTAITSAAIEASEAARELWIAADDEGRPKELYQRLGFHPAWKMMQFVVLR